MFHLECFDTNLIQFTAMSASRIESNSTAVTDQTCSFRMRWCGIGCLWRRIACPFASTSRL